MFIESKNIKNLFSDMPCMLISGDTEFCLEGYHMFSSAPKPYVTHILYIVEDYRELLEKELIANMHFLILTNDIDQTSHALKELRPKLHLLILQTSDHAPVLSLLQNYFDEKCGTGLFAESLLEILFFEGGIQSMVDTAFNAFQNPICVFDAGFNIIAATWDELSKTEQGRKMIEKGGFTDTEYEIINRKEHIHERLKKSELPIRTYHPDLGFEQLLCSISSTKDVGHIVINAVKHPFSPADEKFMLLLKKAIDQQLKKDEFIRSNKGFHYEFFMRDLLDGKIATGSDNLKYMNYANSEFSGTLYCLVVETARSSSTLNKTHIKNLLEQLFPGTKTLLYNGEIIALIRCPAGKPLSAQDYNSVRELCRQQEIYAGISNAFEKITHLSSYYKQCLRAIELGVVSEDKPNLFVYGDYYLKHITNLFSEKESPDTFCHPKLKVLFKYDKKHSAQLAYTLYMYLISERNVAYTAENMFVHRNTINYRLKKIDSLVNIDYENYSERQYIILSYELCCNRE